jgi:hypothetical protein
MLSLLSLSLVAPVAACDELAPLLETLEAKVLALEPEQAAALLPDIEAGIQCQVPADPTILARAWVGLGVASGLADQTEDRDLYLSAARQIAPTWRSPAFPDDMQAPPPLVSGAGILTLSAPLGNSALYVDAERTTLPAAEMSLEHFYQEAGFPGGYQLPDQGFAPTLVAGLAEGLDIRLEQGVTHITTSEQGVVVDTWTHTFTSEQIVVTVPLGVLKAGTITFEPPPSPTPSWGRSSGSAWAP